MLSGLAIELQQHRRWSQPGVKRRVRSREVRLPPLLAQFRWRSFEIAILPAICVAMLVETPWWADTFAT